MLHSWLNTGRMNTYTQLEHCTFRNAYVHKMYVVPTVLRELLTLIMLNMYSVTLYTYVHVCTCSTLQSIYKEIQSERDRLVEKLSDLKRSAAPRPEWSRCGIYIEGGPER